MQITYWSEADWTSDEQKLRYIDKNSGYFVNRIISQYLEVTPEINSVEIETLNRCNNDCSFCPVSKGNDIREPLKMEPELFRKIIDDLAGRGYHGYLSLFSNNEPLLDVRIYDFLDYAKKMLPEAKHVMYTNGTLLNEDNYLKLISILDYLIIDNYDDSFQLMANVWNLSKLRIPENLKCQVRVEVRKKNQVLSNRAGLAPNKHKNATYYSGCILPFFQMVIRPDGKVSRCCQDAYGNVTTADLSYESVDEAWKSKESAQARKLMIEKGRSAVKGCVGCDVFGLSNHFPLSWIHEYTNIFLDLLLSKKSDGKKLIVVGDIGACSKMIELIEIHGIEVDGISEELYSLCEDEFYILNNYAWKTVEFFSPEEAVGKYIIFEDPGQSVLMPKKKTVITHGIKDMFRLIRNAESENKLVVFGAGRNATRLSEAYNLDVAYYIDNDPDRVGEDFFGRIIRTVSAILIDNAIILVSANDFMSMKKQLLEMGVDNDRILDGNRLL